MGETAKRDFVQQLIIHWQQYKGWRLVELGEALPAGVRRMLPRLGFKDAVDKLILRTAYQTDDKLVVSNDPDFWDPKDRKRFGDPSAPIASLCRAQLGVVVSSLKAIVDALAEPPRA